MVPGTNYSWLIFATVGKSNGWKRNVCVRLSKKEMCPLKHNFKRCCFWTRWNRTMCAGRHEFIHSSLNSSFNQTWSQATQVNQQQLARISYKSSCFFSYWHMFCCPIVNRFVFPMWQIIRANKAWQATFGVFLPISTCLRKIVGWNGIKSLRFSKYNIN